MTIDGHVFFPHSLGLLYLAVTQYLGFPNYGDEFKVMGLAPYGEPRYAREIESLVHLRDDGGFELDLSYFRHWSDGVQMTWEDGEPKLGPVFTPKLESLLGPARRRDEPVEPQHEAIAASLQVAHERAALHVLRHVQKAHRQHEAVPGRRLRDEQRRQRQDPRTDRLPRRLHPAGVRRQRHGPRRGLLRLEPDRPAGRAASSWSTATGGRRSATTRSWRRSTRSRPAIAERGCARRAWTDEAALDDWTAAQIADGRVVGWYQGRMEWGARALGNRSIVADPRRADMREIINTRIKFRERFRPFAPSVLEEALDEYFVGAVPDPFMLQVYPVRPDKRAVVPGDHARGRIGTAADGERPDEPALLQPDQGLRAPQRRADAPEHLVQRKRADRADAGAGARLLPAERAWTCW